MENNRDSNKLSIQMANFSQSLINEKVSFKDIIEYFGSGGFYILLIIFAMPTVIPIPYPPGVTMLTGIPLIILSIQMIFSKKSPSLPKWLMKLQVKKALIIKIIDKIQPYIRKIENISRRRVLILSSVIGEKIVGLFCLISGILVASPLLFSHSIPALGIIIMGFGLLNKDGLMVLIGMLISAAGLVVVSIILYWTIIGSKSLLNHIF